MWKRINSEGREGAAVETATQPDLENSFRGWFNNHMSMILMMIQYVKAKEPVALIRRELFLTDIEHHFIPSNAPASVYRAFRYLRRYLKVYPRKVEKHSARAIEMVGRIYEALNMEFKFKQEERTLCLTTNII